MANLVRIAAVAAFAVVSGVGTAEAADYIPEPPLVIEQPIIEYAPAPYYARVDCGHAVNDDANLRVGNPELHFIQKNGGIVETDDSWVCGIGFGHRVWQNVRVDATLEYRSSFDVKGFADPFFPHPGGGESLSQFTQVTSTVGLVNAYWDFANWHGMTPYVGAGIGVAHNEIDDIFIPESGFVTEGGDDTEFAWALMAGLAFDLSENMILDVGYRYIDFGDVKSGIQGSDGGTTSPVLVRDMDAQEIRVGFRYEFY